MMGMGEPLYNLDAVRDALLDRRRRRRHRHLQAPHHALDLRRGADDRARRRRDRLHAGGVAARGARRVAQRAGAAQPQIPDRAIARGLPQLSRRFQRQAHHLRIRHAQGRQRFASTTPRRWCGCSRASRPRSTSFRSIPGRAANTNAPTGSRSRSFPQVVFDAGYASPVRTPRGRDILAACGQLKSASEKLSARERMALRAMAMTE